ncbi:DEAD/DEAH box helicase [Desulfomarina sp.]
MHLSSDTPPIRSFSDLELPTSLIKSLDEAGYAAPTPIQDEMIPNMIAGKDVIGQAQTGTGKTAAFALPLLAGLPDGNQKAPRILVLTPTRELAIQVAQSFKKYGKHLKNIKVCPIFGGQDYSIQTKQLRRGVQIVVGTPGRIMDHIRRKTLDLSMLTNLVLDEADEMLKMGFIDDIEWILQQTPKKKQIALFSATMPPSIRHIARKYLTNPVEITIKTKTISARTINQRYLLTRSFLQKFDALSKILEAEDSDGVLIFVRTRVQTVELAEKLSRLGYRCSALNGDIQQNQRTRTVEQLKSGKIDILIATDVAARGLDVERISHVINFDVPFDAEAYIHRIGRTGRAGRRGEAILFITARERSMLKTIERLSRQKIEEMKLPTVRTINLRRIENFKRGIAKALKEDISFYRELIREFSEETNASAEDIAAALASLAQGGKPLLLKENSISAKGKKHRKQMEPVQHPPEQGMERYRIEVGREHGVKPGNIVGAIAGEADIDSRHIGRIAIFDSFSTVDLPTGMPRDIYRLLQKVWINNRPLKIKRTAGESGHSTQKQKPGRQKKRFSGKKRHKRNFSLSASL